MYPVDGFIPEGYVGLLGVMKEHQAPELVEQAAVARLVFMICSYPFWAAAESRKSNVFLSDILLGGMQARDPLCEEEVRLAVYFTLKSVQWSATGGNSRACLACYKALSVVPNRTPVV